MIQLSVIDLFYFVATFFLIIVGTLLTLVLLRVLKILAVGVELSNYYWNIKKIIGYYMYVPFVIKEQFFSYFAKLGGKNKQEETNTAEK